MSGHSKWATIKRQKGVNDAKRGQLFTKLANAITIAVKQGGGNSDPNFNAPLRIAIDKAKDSNMPKDNIDRAIQKGVGNGAGSELFEVLYEGFGPGGVAILIEAVTDKKQRTVAEVKSILEKNGGSMAGQGAVSYLFSKTGEILVLKEDKTSDEILEIALENNIEDIEEDEEMAIFYVDPQKLSISKLSLESSGLKVSEASFSYRPLNTVSAESATEDKVVRLLEKIEDLDDVLKVYTNLKFGN